MPLHPGLRSSPFRVWFGGAQLAVLAAATAVLLPDLAWVQGQGLAWLAVFAVQAWAAVATMRGRLPILHALLIDACAVAAVVGAHHLEPARFVVQPLALALGFLCLPRGQRAGAQSTHRIAAGLAASIASDCLQFLPGGFTAALFAFIVAQLCYVAALMPAAPRLPDRRIWAATATAMLAMYLLQFPHIPFTLRVVAAVYCSVMALLVAQAIGRAQALRDRASMAVAAGAVLLMCSDWLITIDRYVHPLPGADFWVLSAYYAGQVLLVLNVAARGAPSAAPRPVVAAG